MTHMYSKSKIVQIGKLMDARWKTEEKILQYKSVLTIFGREIEKEINEANKVRRLQSQKIRELRADCVYFRKALKESMFGNKQRLRNALQPNRSIQLCYQRLIADRVLDHFQYANNIKQRQLDLLKYRKSKRMDLYTHLKFEKAELQDRLEIGFDNIPFRRTVQVLTNRIEMFVVRQNAAAQVYKLYKNMLNLLQNDSHYFDSMLVVLHSHTEEQCRCILQAAELGQLAHEDLSDCQEEYKWLEREVKINMRERRREVVSIRKAAEELLIKCRMLTRAESYAYVFNPSDTSSYFPLQSLENETQELEVVMRKVQDATLSSSIFDIVPRMVEQLHQEETLLKQMKKMTMARDRVLHMKRHSEMLLATLTHTETASTTRYKEKKTQLDKELEEEKFRLKREKETIDDFGKMLATMKIALQGLFETVHRLKEKSFDEPIEAASDIDLEMQEDLTPEQIEETFPPPIDRNAKMLLGKVSDKLSMISIYASASLDEETVAEARVVHQNQVLASRSAVGPVIESDAPLLVEHETEDAGILNREQIKLKSKQMVEEHDRLVMMAEMGPAALAKMRRRF